MPKYELSNMQSPLRRSTVQNWALSAPSEFCRDMSSFHVFCGRFSKYGLILFCRKKTYYNSKGISYGLIWKSYHIWKLWTHLFISCSNSLVGKHGQGWYLHICSHSAPCLCIQPLLPPIILGVALLTINSCIHFQWARELLTESQHTISASSCLGKIITNIWTDASLFSLLPRVIFKVAWVHAAN